MSFTLNVTFRGLNALVPSEALHAFEGPTREEQTIRHLRILTLDAKKGKVTINADGKCCDLPVCAHHPVVIVEQPGGRVRRLKLARHWIKLDTNGSSKGVTFDPSVGRVPRLASAVSPKVEIRTDPRLLIEPPDSPDARVIASVFLESGTVFGAAASPVLTEFKNPDRDYRDFFFTEVRVELPVEGDRASLCLAPYDGGDPIHIDLAPRRGRRSLNLTISNLCKRDDGDEEAPDADFARYYDLLDGYVGDRYVPHPVRQVPVPTVGLMSSSGRPCVDGFLPDAP